MKSGMIFAIPVFLTVFLRKTIAPDRDYVTVKGLAVVRLMSDAAAL